MKTTEKLQKAVKGLGFATVTNYNFVTFADVKDLHYNFPFNAKSICKFSHISKKSISEVRNEVVNHHAKQLHSMLVYSETINMISLKEQQGWKISGNWTMTGRVELYKNGFHTSVKTEELKNL